MERVMISRIQAVWATAGWAVAVNGNRDFMVAIHELSKLPNEELEKLAQLAIDDVHSMYDVHIKEQLVPTVRPQLRLVKKI